MYVQIVPLKKKKICQYFLKIIYGKPPLEFNIIYATVQGYELRMRVLRSNLEPHVRIVCPVQPHNFCREGGLVFRLR